MCFNFMDVFNMVILVSFNFMRHSIFSLHDMLVVDEKEET